MKRAILLFVSLFAYASLLSQGQDIAVQSMHSEGVSSSKLDTTRNLLVSYGYKDQTLKFWDNTTGQLLHTEDLEGYNNDLEINVKDGKTYTLVNNTVIVYSNETFKEINRYPLGRIFAMYYNDTMQPAGLLVYAQDVNGAAAMYSLDEANGTFVPAQLAPFQGDGEINHFELSPSNGHMWIATNYMNNYIYSFESGKSFVTQDYVMDLMDDGDVLLASYNYADKSAIFMRYNYFDNSTQWEQKLTVDLPYETVTPYIGDMALNSDRKSVWAAPGNSLLVELDAASGYIKGKIYREEEKRALLASGDFLYVQSGVENPYAKFKRYEKTPLIEYGYNLFETSHIDMFKGEAENELIVADFYGKPYSLLFNEATTRFTNYNFTNTDNQQYNTLIADQDDHNFYSISGQSLPIIQFTRGASESQKKLSRSLSNAQFNDYDSNKKLLASLGNNNIRILDVVENREVYLGILGSGTAFGNHLIDLSPTANAVAYVFEESFEKDAMEYLDYDTRQVRWSKSGSYRDLWHIDQGRALLVVNFGEQRVEILDVNDGSLIRSFETDNGEAYKEGVLSPNGKYILFQGYKKPTSIYEVASGKRVSQFKSNMFDFGAATFVTEEIVAVPASGALKFINIIDHKEVLRLYIFQDNEWIVHTKEGLFDGSSGAWDRVAFTQGNQSIPLESVFDNFYTPRLLHKILNGGTIEKPKRDIENLKKAPVVTITYKEGSRNLTVEDDVQKTATITTQNATGEIILQADARGDKIQELRLYQNGKLLSNNTRNLVVEDDVDTEKNTKSYKINLIEGANDFVAIAVNSQQTESRPDKLTVIYKPAKSVPAPKGLQAHVMIVGIDSYKNSKYDLNYAVADATSFLQSVENGVKNITSKVNVYEIKNSEAVRENILNKFEQIVNNANPQDIFVFYYAGHGVISQDDANEFYLVPHDVTQLYGDDGALKQKGISAKELKQISSNIPAQKQLFILDACQSAGALSTVAMRGAAEEKAIAQLARSTGTHWLTASGSQQFATEFDELGHGVFTYALLEALSGKADSGDNRVTVNEIKAYIESRVPEISAKYKGSPQYPSSFGFGQDFPVSIKK